MQITGDNRQPLLLTAADPTDLLASIGRDGVIGRNSFRGPDLFTTDVALNKNWATRGSQRLQLRIEIFNLTNRTNFARIEIFNLTNRTNFALPVRALEAPGFGQVTTTLTPGRRVQFALKYLF